MNSLKHFHIVIVGVLLCAGLVGCLGRAHPSLPATSPGTAEAPASPPAETAVPTLLRDLEYTRYTLDGVDHPLALDLYLPAGDTPHPLLLYIHGGGWMEGSKDGCPAEPFVQRGYAVACVDYRLARATPEGCPAELSFPAPVRDLRAAVRWLRQHAAEYGLDPDRFGAFGDSSGGHLAALLGVSHGVPIPGEAANEGASDAVQAVADWFGPVDVTQGPVAFEDDPCTTPWDTLVATYGGEETPYFYWTAAWGMFLGGSLADPAVLERAAQASPLTYIDADDPPFLIVHGEADDMVPPEQSERLATALQEAGVEVTLLRLPDVGHGFGSPDGGVMPEFLEPTLAFFDHYLLSRGEGPSSGKGGPLTHDETWSGEVLVTDTVIVPQGVTLTIAPGTVVEFRHYRGYREGKVGLLVAGGTVQAIGTPEQQIWFTSDAEQPINGDWAGITLVEAHDSRFDYVIVEYGEIGIEQFASQADVSHSIIRWNNSEGLYAELSGATFEGNTIYGNAYHAIALENYNQDIRIVGNLILGPGHQSIHLEASQALIEGNYFKNFDVSDPWERVISLMFGSQATVRGNKFEMQGGSDPFSVEPGSTLVSEDNDFGDGHISPPQFDYRDVKKTELGYLPGSAEDRYLYVFDAEDETRRVVARHGKGLGLGWGVAYADGAIWRFTASDAFVRIDPATGEVDYAHEYANPTHIAVRGLAYDGETFWAQDHIRGQIVQFRLGSGGGYPDVGSGSAIEVLSTFDYPEELEGGSAGIATDGEYLYIPSEGRPDTLLKLDKQGNVVDRIRFEAPFGPAITWDGTYFWAGGGNTIQQWTADGRFVGMIYAPAVETWDLAWGGGYLWTINRTCENWNDAKIFQVEVLNPLTTPAEMGEPLPAEEPPPPEEVADVSGPRTFDVTIDAAQTGAPISPYLYGAFIEHQGRCIYGGVWAEMLEDRKFYYPVEYYFPWGEEKGKSPWHAIPFDTVVTMDSGKPYVGAHAPRVDLEGAKPRGIAQDGLGLVAGQEYEGYVLLAAGGTVSAEVRLVWGPGPDGRQVVSLGPVPESYTRFPFRFTAGADGDDGRLEIVGRGTGRLYIGPASLMPADNVEGMRADVIALLREIGFTVYRWPGGLFVNDYDWQQAVGERDKRPPRINHAYWSEMVESNDFGLDEFLTLCRLVDAEPYVVVSATGPDDAQMAAGEVEYLNGPAGEGMGALRAANGHPEPYHVRFFGIGNEMWDVPLEKYVEWHNEIAEAMRAVDPDIELVAVGGIGFEGLPEGGDWSEGMLTRCAENMSFISEHIYGGSSPNLVEHAQSIAWGVRESVAAHRGYRQRLDALRDKDIRLALDEWNYFWGDRYEIYGEAAPRYYFRDALGVAVGLHEMFRNSDIIFMANTHPVNVHGQVKTTKTEAAIEATGLVWELYRHHFGTLPLEVSGDVAPLDVAAAWSEDRQALTIAVVNPTEYTHTLALSLQNAQLSGEGQVWVIANSDPSAYNEPGYPARVVIEERQVEGLSGELSIAPLSISLYELTAR